MPGKDRGWIGSRVEVPAWSPGAPGVAGRFAHLRGSVWFPGETVHRLCQLFKGRHAPKCGRTFAEREVGLTPGRSCLWSQGCCQCAVFSEASHFPPPEGQARGWRSQLSTQAQALLPHERGGPWSGDQAARMSSPPATTQGVFHREQNCLQFWAPPVPSAVTAGYLPR